MTPQRTVVLKGPCCQDTWMARKGCEERVGVKPITLESTEGIWSLHFFSLDIALQTHIFQAKSLLNQLFPILSAYKSLKWDIPEHF